VSTLLETPGTSKAGDAAADDDDSCHSPKEALPQTSLAYSRWRMAYAGLAGQALATLTT
jgi:hypothetical protein